MVVGVCSIDLHIPGNDSLKGKRSVVRRIKERVRNTFNVSVAEVEDLDKLQRAGLGISSTITSKSGKPDASLQTF
jgi:uncharacterized protein YlxP (DUF503 family)